MNQWFLDKYKCYFLVCVCSFNSCIVCILAPQATNLGDMSQGYVCRVCGVNFASARYLDRHGDSKKHKYQQELLLRDNYGKDEVEQPSQITKRLCTSTTTSVVTQTSLTASTAVTSSHHSMVFLQGYIRMENNSTQEDDVTDIEKINQWNDLYEDTDDDTDETMFTEEKDPLDQSFHPFRNEHYAELACLLCAPRPLGDANLKYIFYLLRKRDLTTPTLYQVKQHLAELPGTLEPSVFSDCQGQSYYSLSVIDIIRRKLAIPSLSFKLVHYPKKSTNNAIREMYEAKKWKLHQTYHTPMVEVNNEAYFLKDFVWFDNEGIENLGYISSIYIEMTQAECGGQPDVFVKLIICEIHNNKVCHTNRVLNIHSDQLKYQYQGSLNFETVGWKMTEKGLQRLPNEFIKSAISGHPTKKLARQLGKSIVTVPVVLFSDDVGSSRTRKWSPLSVWCIMLGGLPKKENNKLQNISVVNASTSVGAVELSKPLVAELKVLEKTGVVMYHGDLDSEVLVISPVLLVKADNVRQSEMVNHTGATSIKFCQRCTVSRDDPCTLGNPRTKDITKDSMREIASAQTESSKKKLRTQFGLYEHENPLMELETFDNGRSLAFERLHNIELGIVKIFTQLTFESMTARDRELLELKLKAFDWTPFKRTLSPSFIDKFQSYVGRDFKLWAQIAIFILAGNISAQHLRLWHLISEVFILVHKDCLLIDELHVSEMKGLVHNLVRQIRTLFPSSLNKPKVHMLLHLVDDIMDYGPCDCTDTERCESLMGLVRVQYLFTNHHNTSRDLAINFGRLQQIRFILQGGYWKDITDYRCCGEGVKRMNKKSEVQQFMYGRRETVEHSKGYLRKLVGTCDMEANEDNSCFTNLMSPMVNYRDV
ncbi:uncharacterized protein [Ptychodera flava]|uniref:uncharacterized protein isoform X2 n=1 Tax=Ptychodera flava TaxID=63121 RepID=UPI00396A4F2C